MKGIPNTERQRLGALLDHETQETVMAMIPQFSETEIGAPVPAPAEVPEELGLLVFNMERGVHLEELGDFLQDCPGVRPLDVVLANELDDGCVRSGGRNTARELAERFGWNYAYGLEFIELVNGEDPKGFHGNAVFSRWPIRRAWTVRLPEQYNWYFDRQRRIGGRCAVLAELDVGGRPLGVASIHLENRTHGEGRRLQLEAVLRAAEELLPGIPVVLGGDLNTMLPPVPASVSTHCSPEASVKRIMTRQIKRPTTVFCLHSSVLPHSACSESSDHGRFSPCRPTIRRSLSTACSI